MELFLKINEVIHSVVWGPVMLLLLLGFGVYLTFALRFFQITRFPLILHRTFGKLFQKKDPSRGISPFQAVTTALAGTLGTGNIVGVATAIIGGGPGAIFWMWVSAFFGMATKYAEVFLAVKFRKYDTNGKPFGGPMYYILDGMHSKTLAVLFCLFCCLASFGIGSMVQANSVSGALLSTFRIPAWISGILLAFLAALVILGGIQRIGKISEKIVPLMALFYCVFVVWGLIVNRSRISGAFGMIFSCAFSSHAVFGGAAGYAVMLAVRYGFSRGIFSNEAGLGSAPIAHAAADTNSPVEQGMWGIFEVFFDTIVSCTMTALILLTSGLCFHGLNGAELTLSAFAEAIGPISQTVIAVSMVFFAFASMIGWAYYGEKCMEFLFRRSSMITFYRSVYVCSIVLGSVVNLRLVWLISDTLNGLMAIPNIAALIFLCPVVIKGTKDYLNRRKKEGTRRMRRER